MIATFTLAARDPATDTYAVITASNFLAVGSLVPWVDARGGIVVSQSFAHPESARLALDNLRHETPLARVLESYLEDDPIASKRQLGLMNRHGECLLYDGPECTPAVESIQGDNFFACGNMLVQGTIDVVASTFTDALRHGLELGDAMLRAMLAGQQHGGDYRGKLAAALLIKRPGAGYLGSSDTLVDLRVDASAHPLAELRDLYSLFKLYNPQHFAHNMIPEAQLSPADNKLLASILALLKQSSESVPHEPEQVLTLLATHNLASNYDMKKNRFSSLLFSEGHALLRLLRV
ncbi:DUF1028 domain-containing protein [Aliidiomarina indica]|uniref:DUF1028 domain-containing protein n=1 Tax=Aliidiomarina indica TaxID=2749147 RepID=UPI00188FDB85|nr:DUF1028 domain-containing protein [Aliidiomarina indica]